jgi:hypothetical protein
VAQLARRYAAAIDQAADQAWAARWLMPELLRVLVALRATPMARRQAGIPGPGLVSRLDGLLAARPRPSL